MKEIIKQELERLKEVHNTLKSRLDMIECNLSLLGHLLETENEIKNEKKQKKEVN